MRARLGTLGTGITHLSCLVWFTMERTLSSPSIFGLPNSSSFTCCRKQSRAQSHSQAWSAALGRGEPRVGWTHPPALPQLLGAAAPPARGGRMLQGEPGHEHSTPGAPRAPALAPQGKAQQSKHFCKPLPTCKKLFFRGFHNN